MKSITPATIRPLIPRPSEPGTLRQQLQIVALYVANPWRCSDRDRRWLAARRTILQHARRATI